MNTSKAKLLKFSGGLMIIIASAGVLGVKSAQASTFVFRKYVGEYWINQVTVEQGIYTRHYPGSSGGTHAGSGANGGSTLPVMVPPTPPRTTQEQAVVLGASFKIPTCPAKFHTEGYVTIKYRNGDAYITRSYEINRGNEGQTVTPSWTVWGYFGNPDVGNVNVSTSVSCVRHRYF